MPTAQSKVVNISTGYIPRSLQAEIHSSMARFNVLVCHRRFGKTVLSINELVDQALRCRLPNPRFAYLAPYYKQAKQISWTYLKDYTRMVPGVSINEAELRVDFPNGARIQLLGADNPDALRGIYLDGVVLDEYAQMEPKTWTEVIRPALADRKGFAIFIGTPKGRNAFYDVYMAAVGDPKWFSALYRASETDVIDADELKDARSKMTEDEYEQEFECSFSASLVGAYYKKEIASLEKSDRITAVPYDPGRPVHTSWDLGIGDSTSIWFFQNVGLEHRIIDFYENNGVGLDHYAKVLKEKPYSYGTHILPHDAAHDQISTGKSIEASLNGLGINQTEVLPVASVEIGIQSVRRMLPACVFDARNCQKGLECLRQYRREWSEKNLVFRAKPLHDWTSHAADALRYMAMGLDRLDEDFTANFHRDINYPSLNVA